MLQKLTINVGKKRVNPPLTRRCMLAIHFNQLVTIEMLFHLRSLMV